MYVGRSGINTGHGKYSLPSQTLSGSGWGGSISHALCLSHFCPHTPFLPCSPTWGTAAGSCRARWRGQFPLLALISTFPKDSTVMARHLGCRHPEPAIPAPAAAAPGEMSYRQDPWAQEMSCLARPLGPGHWQEKDLAALHAVLCPQTPA